METDLITPDTLRSHFSAAMSDMYRQEVPQYQTLLDLVAAVNEETLARQPQLAEQLALQQQLTRLNQERHGAIRVGTAAELAQLREVFALMGMYPVGYYDLSPSGIPVHSTAFRPVAPDALALNPFRIFTSLLRLELITDPLLRQKAQDVLAARHIFHPDLATLVDTAQQQGGLKADQLTCFIDRVLYTFRWHADALVEQSLYDDLLEQHRLLADVVCFRGPHINHLTPRTLDIDRAQQRMLDLSMHPKQVVEGPPARSCPILLRQTSFRALSEPIRFSDGQLGEHTARFGEIEQRGAALTPKGRALYDRLLDKTLQLQARVSAQALSRSGHQDFDYTHSLQQHFSEFPDDETTLRQQQLAYFSYQLQDPEKPLSQKHLANLSEILDEGLLLASPITYEDFLPVSAAGIFQSNLADADTALHASQANQEQFEAALGCAVLDPFSLYAQSEQASLKRCFSIK